MTSQSQTRELCQRALDSALGIEVRFDAQAFEFGADEAWREAITLQRRIRAFKLKAKGFSEIDASVERTGDGKAVILRVVPHGLSLPLKGEVRDIETGHLLEGFSEIATNVNAITYHLLRHMDEPAPPITPEQETLLFTHSPDAARDLYAAANWTRKEKPDALP